MSGEGAVPINDAFLLVSEAVYLLLVALSDQRFLVVPDGGIGAWDIVGVQRTHK